jgi:hypothetical protein
MGPIHIVSDGGLHGPIIVMQTANPQYLYPFMIAAAMSDLDGCVMRFGFVAVRQKRSE